MVKNPTKRKELLEFIYEAHAEWIAQYDIACMAGCNSCCTQSVNITHMEGELIIAFLTNEDRWPTSEILADSIPNQSYPSYTTNQFAEQCFAGSPEIDEEEVWDFTPCFFLDVKGACSIYPARPFMCRGFVSSSNCSKSGYAETKPEIVSVNSFVMQLIEHIDHGSIWGNMRAVLQAIASEHFDTSAQEKKTHPVNLLISRKIPGFLVPPEDQTAVNSFCNKLNSRGISLAQLLNSIQE